MNRNFASAITLATTTAAAALLAAIGANSAYAETPTIDTTPFVSTRSRADVQAELMGNRQLLSAAASEWAMQHNEVSQLNSGYTAAQAKAQYRAARDEVSAMTSEDSGSSYFARHSVRAGGSTIVAGPAR